MNLSNASIKYCLLIALLACSTLHISCNANELVILHDQLEILGNQIQKNISPAGVPAESSKTPFQSIGRWFTYAKETITGPIIFHPSEPNKLFCCNNDKSFYNVVVEKDSIHIKSKLSAKDRGYITSIHSENDLKTENLYVIGLEKTNGRAYYLQHSIDKNIYSYGLSSSDLEKSGIDPDKIFSSNSLLAPPTFETIQQAMIFKVQDNLSTLEKNKQMALKWLLRMALYETVHTFCTVDSSQDTLELKQLNKTQNGTWDLEYRDVAQKTFNQLKKESEDAGENYEMISCNRVGLIPGKPYLYSVYLVKYYKKNDKNTTLSFHTRLVGYHWSGMPAQDFGPTKEIALTINTKNISVVAVDNMGNVMLYTLPCDTEFEKRTWNIPKKLDSVKFDGEKARVYLAIAGNGSKCALVKHTGNDGEHTHELYISDLTQEDPKLEKIKIDPAEMGNLQEIKMNVDGSMIGCIKREDTKASEDEGSDSVWAYDYLRVLKLNPSVTLQS